MSLLSCFARLAGRWQPQHVCRQPTTVLWCPPLCVCYSTHLARYSSFFCCRLLGTLVGSASLDNDSAANELAKLLLLAPRRLLLLMVSVCVLAMCKCAGYVSAAATIVVA